MLLLFFSEPILEIESFDESPMKAVNTVLTSKESNNHQNKVQEKNDDIAKVLIEKKNRRISGVSVASKNRT